MKFQRGIATANIQHFFNMTKEMSIILSFFIKIVCILFIQTQKSPLALGSTNGIGVKHYIKYVGQRYRCGLTMNYE